MDSTHALIDQMRFKIRFHPFNRLRFWFVSALIVLSACSVAWTIRFLLAHRAQLIGKF